MQTAHLKNIVMPHMPTGIALLRSWLDTKKWKQRDAETERARKLP
jgi:hypothetical protein